MTIDVVAQAFRVVRVRTSSCARARTTTRYTAASRRFDWTVK